jgi:hypothetical protein
MCQVAGVMCLGSGYARIWGISAYVLEQEQPESPFHRFTPSHFLPSPPAHRLPNTRPETVLVARAGESASLPMPS